MFFLFLFFLVVVPALKVIVARLGHDICHAPCHFLQKVTCKVPDALDTTSIAHRTFAISVRTPLAFLVAILVVLVLIHRVSVTTLTKHELTAK